MKLDLNLTPEEQEKQVYYRDARTDGYYGKIWTTVGKCVFCDLNEKYVFFEENGIVMTVSLYAYLDGHFMIVPRRHIRSPKELTQVEWETVRKFAYIAKKLIKEVHGIRGMQIVQKDGANAQSTVDQHLHFHCIPFDAPDLCEWNYRKLKYTPLENAELFRQQRSKIEKLSEKFNEKYTEEVELLPKSHDKKATYRQAFQQVLANKKASKAKKTAKVGAAIIAGDKIISLPNASLIDGPMEYEKDDGTWTSPPTVSHAEERCISQAAKQGVVLDGAIMIVTLSPCMACSRMIFNSGIKELHYIDDWWDQEALGFLRENDIKVVKIPRKKG